MAVPEPEVDREMKVFHVYWISRRRAETVGVNASSNPPNSSCHQPSHAQSYHEQMMLPLCVQQVNLLHVREGCLAYRQLRLAPCMKDRLPPQDLSDVAKADSFCRRRCPCSCFLWNRARGRRLLTPVEHDNLIRPRRYRAACALELREQSLGNLFSPRGLRGNSPLASMRS